jgi:hypothetical protein
MYHELQITHIVATLRRLHQRISERFPESGLSNVGAELLKLAEETGPILERQRRPHRFIQLGAVAIILLLVTIPIAGLAWRGIPAMELRDLPTVLQVIESAIQDVIFLGLAVYFVFTIETRLDRRGSLRELQRLRNIVHIIDMHQLTKDPEHLISPDLTTPSSPARMLSHFEMSRYLDYCTELLSLSSKIAAVHLQAVNDPVVLSAVSDIEVLSSNLSNKIWQKINVIDAERRSVGLPHGE